MAAQGGTSRWLRAAVVVVSVALVALLGTLAYRHFEQGGSPTVSPPVTSTTDTVAHVPKSTQQAAPSVTNALVEAASAVSAAFGPIQGDVNALGSVASQTQSDSTTIQRATQAASAAGYQCSGLASIQSEATTLSSDISAMNGAAQQLQNDLNTLNSDYSQMQSVMRSSGENQVPAGTPSYIEVLNIGLSASGAEASAGDVLATANQNVTAANTAELLPTEVCS